MHRSSTKQTGFDDATDSAITNRPAPSRIDFVLVGVSVICAAMLGLTALQYLMPLSHRYPGPINPHGAWQFARWLWGGLVRPLPVETFAVTFKALVLVAWIAYAVAIWAGFNHGVRRPRLALSLAALTAVMIACTFPTSLTHDLYAYLAFGRMNPLYGLNPYHETLRQLARSGDVVALHYPAPHSSVYGPVWTLLAELIASTLRAVAVPAQLIALKLVGATSLLAAAFSARAIATKWSPRHADLALVAVAFNPVLMLEGAGNGHNDLLMVALLLSGMALVLNSRWEAGCLLIGASVGVKYITLAIVPWIILEQVQVMPWRHAVRRAAAMAALVAVPVVAGFAPFLQRAGPLAAVEAMFNSRNRGDSAAIEGMLLIGVLYVLFSAWIARGRGDRLAASWTVWSLVAIGRAIPGVLPWYFSWPMALTLARWDNRQLVITFVSALLGLYWMLHYMMLRGG